MSATLALTATPAARLEECRALVDDATRRANDAMERAIARQSVPAELAAYRLEEDALALELALCRLEDASPAWWACHAHLTPAVLLAAAAEDHVADTREEDPHR